MKTCEIVNGLAGQLFCDVFEKKNTLVFFRVVNNRLLLKFDDFSMKASICGVIFFGWILFIVLGIFDSTSDFFVRL